MNFLAAYADDMVLLLRSWDVYRQVFSTLVLLLAFFACRWAGIVGIRRWKRAESGRKAALDPLRQKPKPDRIGGRTVRHLGD